VSSGDRIRAERHARELVADMHWRGMIVPPLYTRMAAEFQDLVRSGDYAAWVARGGRPDRRAQGSRDVRHLPVGFS
jgi:hypothetical protein